MIAGLRTFRRYAWAYRRPLAGGGLLAVLTVALGLLQPWPLKVVVDDVLTPALADGRPGNGLLLAAAVLALLAVAGSAAVADYWSTRLLAGAGQRIGADLRRSLFAHLQRLSLRYHGKQTVGDLSTRVTGDVDRIQDMYVQVLATLLPNFLLVGGMFSVMVVIDPFFTGLALLAVPVMAYAIHRSAAQMKSASRRARRFDGQVAAAASESLAAIHVVQAFSLEQDRGRRFGDLTEASLDASLEATRLQARFSPVVDVSAAASTALVLWFGAQRVLSGALSLGVLLVFLSYLGSLYKPIRALSKLSITLSRSAACAERVAAVLAEHPDVADAPGARPAPPLRGAIGLHKVTFSYGREPVLREVDLTIAPGETVALVGPTGAGKSTVAALVPRLFDPQAGAVTVDGVDVRAYTVASLRAQVGLVLQESVLFRGTLRDNIAAGRPDASDDEVERAARLALVDEFAVRLPDGLDTVVGERGADLSGGQRQRVAIARAILRDTPILVLDEPTSALDPASERLVTQALRNLAHGRTCVVIAHRLSTVRRVDRVVVLEAGRVVESGPPGELLAGDGRYRRMVSLQAVGA